MAIDVNMLGHFTGTEALNRWSPLFRRTLLTDGALYVAENGGAFWLLDAIASHQPKAMKNERLRKFQIWELKVNHKSGHAVLTCREDSDVKPAITQRINYTDFELDQIKFYVEFDGEHQTIMLPSEH